MSEKKRLVIANRQPTLWRHGCPGVKIVPTDIHPEVITTSPLFVEPLNQDYDGDTIALYAVHDKTSIEEVYQKAYLKKYVFHDHVDEFLATFRHEALYALYLLTREYEISPLKKIKEIDNLSELTISDDFSLKSYILFNNQKYYIGRAILNKWCGFNDIIIDEPIKKKNIQSINQAIYDHYNQDKEIYYDIMTTLQRNLLFFVSITKDFPTTINIDQMLDVVDEKTNDLFNKIPDNINIGYLINEGLIRRCLKNEQDNSFFNLYNSGGRIGKSQLSRSCINIGFTADAGNVITPKSINSNLLSGLTEEEFFTGASGTRKG